MQITQTNEVFASQDLDFIQHRIRYRFRNLAYLKLALRAANRDDKLGIVDDGNRGLARMGQNAVVMTETCFAVEVEKARSGRCPPIIKV